MAEWNLPFAPPQQMFELREEEEADSGEYNPEIFLVCSQCNKPIKQGQECMEMVPGVSGFGSKSGRPAAVNAEDLNHDYAVLHIKCIYNWVFGIEEANEVQFCAACEAELEAE